MLEDAPSDEHENRRLPAQRRGKKSLDHPSWSRLVTEAHRKSDKGGLWPGLVRVVERGTLMFSAPCSKFVQHAMMYAGYVFALSYQVLVSPPRDQTFSDVEYVVLAWSIALLCGQLWRAYKITAHDGGVATGGYTYFTNFWNLIRFSTTSLYIASCITHVQVPRVAWQVQAITFLLAYISFLQKFAVSRQLGPLLVMIGKMFKDISSFVVIWAIFLIGFAGAIQLSVMAQVIHS